MPIKGYCFVKCFNYLTGKNFNQELLVFIRNEKKRPDVMTMARI